jgi:hypothetical protein
MIPPYQAISLTANGLLRDIKTSVILRLANNLAKLYKIPEKTEQVIALWDTGATTSSISSGLAARLSLPAIGMAQVQAAGGIHDSRLFSIDIIFPQPNFIINNVEATEFKDNGVFDVLIGMDIITLGDFSITNANMQTVFSYRIPPDAFHIDYVAMSQKSHSNDELLKRFKRKQKR